MVRINLIEPKRLADQHLIAEYDEILMLFGYVRRYPKLKEMPPNYTLGKGHMLFFKNKLLYLKKRHELLRNEMRKRGFAQRVKINLNKFPPCLRHDWVPSVDDKKIIKQRLTQKFKKKPNYYRYYRDEKSLAFFLRLVNQA
jgi:deoxyribonuclease (pyrimidine dimer)